MLVSLVCAIFSLKVHWPNGHNIIYRNGQYSANGDIESKYLMTISVELFK